MITLEEESVPWDIEDLWHVGEKSGAMYLKAVPLLILENWVRGGRQTGEANLVRTEALADRLASSKVGGFDRKLKNTLFGALIKIQKGGRDRKPPNPKFIAREAGGIYRIELPYYEDLLQEYRKRYYEKYPKDYEKLFPSGTEPEWERESNRSQFPSQAFEPEVTRKQADVQPPSLENKILQVVQEYAGAWEERLQDADNRARSLEKENQKLEAELGAFKASKHRIVDEELRNDCAEFLKREDTYVDAIRRAGVVLEERLKKTIGGDGLEKFKQGVDLVDYALRKDSGQLIVSEHPAEQEGVHMLFRGAVQFVRNPPSHKKMRYTEVEAAKAIGLIDYLLLLLRQVRRR